MLTLLHPPIAMFSKRSVAKCTWICRSTPAAGTGEDDDDEEAEVDAFIQGLEDGEG